MDFVTPVINMQILAWDHIARRVRYITKLEENVGLLREAMKELIDRRDDVKRTVDVAEIRGLKRTNQVNGWLERAESTEREMTEIEDSFNQRRRCLGDFFTNCCYSYKLGKRVEKKLKDVVELTNKGVFSEVAEKSLPDGVTEMPSVSTVGMDSTVQKVLGYLSEDRVGVIGIYGMGGVGKTTLLKRINNEFIQISHDFDAVIWVAVSKEPNVFNIQKDLRKKLGLPLPDDQEYGVGDIFSFLSRKKFVMLLDDVWSRLDLEKVGIPHPNRQNKGKLLFTTRSEAVCGEMEAQMKIKVECLAWKEGWDLFQEKVGEETMNSHPDIPMLAEEVAKKCGGLPLALITIGRAMASKKTLEEWKHAITVLSKSASKFPGMEDIVLPLLKFSYDSLRGNIVRLCFLYCSLYPEDYSIYKNELINKWIGEGFLDEYDDLDEAREKGYDLIGLLKVACLLEDGENPIIQVKMHDIIRELALWIASDNFIVQAGISLVDSPMLIFEKGKEATKISLMNNELKGLLETPTCPNLITLMLQHNKRLRKISDSFFHFMPLLRVLDLSHTNLKELPIGIGELVELQYLNLSETNITLLPQELVNLVKLKHLDLSHTENLEKIPHNAIAGLSRLQVLNLRGSKWKVESSDDDDDEESGVGFLAKLEGLKQLNDLKITISIDVNAFNKFLGSQIFTNCTRYLVVSYCDALTCFQVSSTFGNMKRLQNLYVSYCDELEKMTIDAEVEGVNQLLPCLESLSLFQLFKLNTILVPCGCLQSLRVVDINGCHKLKNITWVLYLPRLQKIRLVNCKGIEGVIGDEVEAVVRNSVAFPRLKEISLRYLPKLESICRHVLAFPSLQSIYVRHCPKLNRLPFGPDSAKTTLREICGQRDWWNVLWWEDRSLKFALLPYFKPDE